MNGFSLVVLEMVPFILIPPGLLFALFDGKALRIRYSESIEKPVRGQRGQEYGHNEKDGA